MAVMMLVLFSLRGKEIVQNLSLEGKEIVRFLSLKDKISYSFGF